MRAQFPGACSACDEPIAPGQEIEPADDGWAHVVCPDPACVPRCGRCTSNHPGEC